MAVAERDNELTPIGWTVVDATGATVADSLPSRAHAIRRIGYFATSTHPLPLRVLDPSGVPSGDRIG
jgi:hypothetical protein